MAIGEQQAKSAEKLWTELEQAFGAEEARKKEEERIAFDKERGNEKDRSISEPEIVKDSPVSGVDIALKEEEKPVKNADVVDESKDAGATALPDVSSPEPSSLPVKGERSVFDDSSDVEEESNASEKEDEKEPVDIFSRDVQSETMKFTTLKGDAPMGTGWIIRCKRDCFEIIKVDDNGNETSRFFTPRSGGETLVETGGISIHAGNDEIRLRG